MTRPWCLLLLCLAALSSPAWASDEYVREVLEEDDRSDDYDNAYTDETVYQQREQARREELERRRLVQEQEAVRIAEEQAARAAAEREAAFAAELEKMSDDERKAAQKQKKKDAALVRKILKASAHEDWYGVLGISTFNLQIPERTLRFVGKTLLRIPGWSLVATDAGAIKRAYRRVALKVHPDRNRDGRAVEAFHAIEAAAAILMDPQQKTVYDEELRLRRMERRRKIRHAGGRVVGVVARSAKTTRRVLGPFAVPMFVLGGLLV